MANLSSAFGTVTLYGPSPEKLVQLILLQQTSEKNAYYFTALNDIGEKYDEILKIIEPNTKSEIYPYKTKAINFTASGRWSFNSNIEWFFDCITDYSDIYDLTSDHFYAEFEGVDEEWGCDFIGIFTREVTYSPKTKTSEITLNDTCSYPVTATNLIKFCGYDRWQYIDRKFILQNFDEFVEIIKDELDYLKSQEDKVKQNPNLLITVDEHRIVLYQTILDCPDNFKDYLSKQYDSGLYEENYELLEVYLDEEDPDSDEEFIKKLKVRDYF